MKNFTMIPNEIYQDSRLKLFQFKVLTALYRFRNLETGLAFPKRKTLSRMLHCDPNSISRTTKELVELGWLTKTGNGGRSRATRYLMHVPKTLTNENHNQPDRVPMGTDQPMTHCENPDSPVTPFPQKDNQPDRGIEHTEYNPQYNGITSVEVPQGALAPQRAPVDGGDADNIEEELETKTSNTEIGQLFDEMESSESLPSFEELEASRLAIEKIFEEPDASECLLDQDESEEAHADSNSLFSDLASEETESPEHLFGSSEPEGLNVESSFS